MMSNDALDSKLSDGDRSPIKHRPNQSATPWRWYHSAILLAGLLVVGNVCVGLNHLLYQNQGPVFDSMSYYEQLHQVMTVSRTEGLPTALHLACFENKTCCGPFVVASVLGQWLQPSRAVGIWIQMVELGLFLFSLVAYLRFVLGVKPSTCLLACFSLCSIQGWFLPMGGLSDFRMDLSLALMYGTTATWMFIALADTGALLRRRNFVLLGLFAGLTSLFRATAPVYLVVGLGPIAIHALWKSQHRPHLVSRLALAIFVATGVAGWFFWANLDYLKYYYLTWNTDANAALSFATALNHFRFGLKTIGWPATLILAISIVVMHRHTATNQSLSRSFDWRWLYVAIAPVAILVIKRAGLNPFVSMPMATGTIGLALSYAAFRYDQLPHRRQYVLATLILVLVTSNGYRSYDKHANPKNRSMSAHHQLLDLIISDAQRRNEMHVSFGTVQLSEVNSTSLWSVAMFDTDKLAAHLFEAQAGDLTLEIRRLFDLPAVANWNRVPGGNLNEKTEILSQAATGWYDYLIVPDPANRERLIKNPQATLVNERLGELMQEIFARNHWHQVGYTVRSENGNGYQVFRNVANKQTRVSSQTSAAALTR